MHLTTNFYYHQAFSYTKFKLTMHTITLSAQQSAHGTVLLCLYLKPWTFQKYKVFAGILAPNYNFQDYRSKATFNFYHITLSRFWTKIVHPFGSNIKSKLWIASPLGRNILKHSYQHLNWMCIAIRTRMPILIIYFI